MHMESELRGGVEVNGFPIMGIRQSEWGFFAVVKIANQTYGWINLSDCDDKVHGSFGSLEACYREMLSKAGKLVEVIN